MSYEFLDYDGLKHLVKDKIDSRYATKTALTTETTNRITSDNALDARVAALESGGEVGESILTYANREGFPATGNEKKLYVALDTGSAYQYRVVDKSVDPYTKGYVLVGIDTQRLEQARATTVESGLNNRIASLETDLPAETSQRQAADSALDTRLTTAETKLTTIQGNDETEGSINKALKDAKDYTDTEIEALDAEEVGADGSYLQKISQSDGKISATVKEAVSDKDNITDTETNLVQAKAIKGYVDGVKSTLDTTISGIDTRLTTAEGNITTIQGNDETEGSIAYAVKSEQTRATGIESELDTRISTLEDKTALSAFTDDLTYNSETPEESTLKHNHDHLYFKKSNIIVAEPTTDPWNLTDQDKVISAELASKIETRVYNLETGGAGEIRNVYLDDASVMVDHIAQIKSANIKSLNKIYQVSALPTTGEKYTDYVLMSGTAPYSVYQWLYYKTEEQEQAIWQWKYVCNAGTDNLPLNGDANKLYKTQDNKVYHCYFTTEGETTTIHWIEVGRTSLIPVNTYAELPTTGETDKVYFVIATGKLYQYTSTGYKEISGGSSSEIADLQRRMTSAEELLTAHRNNEEDTTHGFTPTNLTFLKTIADNGVSTDYTTKATARSTLFSQNGAVDLYNDINSSKSDKTDVVQNVTYADNTTGVKQFNKVTYTKTTVEGETYYSKKTDAIVDIDTLKADMLLKTTSEESTYTIKDVSLSSVNNINTILTNLYNDVNTSSTTRTTLHKVDVINDCTTGGANVPLSASQGVVLLGKINTFDSKVSGLTAGFTFKGVVYAKGPRVDGDPEGATYLTTIENPAIGDFYQTLKDSKSYGWNGTDWIELQGMVNIENYFATVNEVAAIIAKYE